MTNFSIFCALIISVSMANAANMECPDYLKGLANPEVVRFGGLKPRTPIQDMANLLLSYVPKTAAEQIQVAMPVFLETNPQQPQQFGDAQENAFAHFGLLQKTPFTAILTRQASSAGSSDLAVILSQALPGHKDIKAIEVSILGKSQTFEIDTHGMIRVPVDLKQLSWDQVVGAKPLYFRPVGWADWFAIQFSNPYMTLNNLVNGIAKSSRSLPSGQLIIDPLGLQGSTNIQNDLRQINEAKNLGFILARTERSQRVHGIYLTKDNSQILTATGGVWVRYRDDLPFKNVYLTQDPRVIDIEEQEGVVSGTGPHYIGATGEIIVNSLMNENVMTLQGTSLPSAGPNGEKLAWGFTHQWVGAWLKPNHAFITTQGNYHWHLNHLTYGNGVQVFTPPEVPHDSNYFGFPKSKD